TCQWSCQKLELLTHHYEIRLCTCMCGGDRVDQLSDALTVLEEGTVIIHCNFSTMSNNPDLFWYQQHPQQPPQYILHMDSYNTYNSPAFSKEHFSSTLSMVNKTVTLKVSAVELRDSAVYYCALRP
uniref:T-cell receptor alpha/delta variable 29.0 n=1 Tax=Lepisosteus oculatus TaxID=7918 RepID=W5MFB8_LEPOC